MSFKMTDDIHIKNWSDLVLLLYTKFDLLFSMSPRWRVFSARCDELSISIFHVLTVSVIHSFGDCS